MRKGMEDVKRAKRFLVAVLIALLVTLGITLLLGWNQTAIAAGLAGFGVGLRLLLISRV